MRYLSGFVFGLLVLTSCSPNSVKEEKDLEKYFSAQQVTGVFGLFDNAQGSFILSDRKRFKDSAYLPASTFKVVNALIGLETGIVKDDSTVIPWDGVTRKVPEWNQDLSMYRAFRVSDVPWFQELARRIGKDTMQHWLDTLGYASRYGRAVINRKDSFWLDNSIKITPDEQLGLMKKLYFNQLPFQRRTCDIVGRMMLMEDNTNYRLSYKTGWGNAENGDALAWVVGWIEENKHPYFFVLQLRSADPNADITAIRMKVLKGILEELGFMKGKK
ncbi:penicillin-binding transpeptidase domain-containing protein [Flavihumibacter profundi]|jgi:beta-lactamase class D|uniref:penicillin-binding transpeptidase domain-containing protein n=1 Tax=Flavihumibacter profundi TaxID=2716883 RepID=UPI001CC52D0C|nr:penicillin-binding transpeptidase domain-containing protein [Flavihumibacter profundi]MBZ5857945.1 class D beta-lactamase [Flavihumibacter profundi]